MCRNVMLWCLADMFERLHVVCQVNDGATRFLFYTLKLIALGSYHFPESYNYIYKH